MPTRHEQQFWGLRGVDDAVLRLIDTDGDGEYGSAADKARYQLTDSSFSVVALVNASSGQVHQRMAARECRSPDTAKAVQWLCSCTNAKCFHAQVNTT